MEREVKKYRHQLIGIVLFVISGFYFTTCQQKVESQEASLDQRHIEKIRDEIIQMGREDQKYRQILHNNPVDTANVSSIASAYELDFLNYNKPLDKVRLLKLMNETDVIRCKRVSQIIDTYGWPARSEFGAEAAEYCFLMIQHADVVTQKKYFPMLESAAKQGEASLKNVAMMKDRILMREGKRQLYGTQFHGMDNTMKLYPIEDEANVDKRRKEMGMEPLNEYLKGNRTK